MKQTFTFLFLALLVGNALGQNDNQKLPPFEMLPQEAGEKKEIYELPHKTIYQLYDIKGVELKDTIGEFIDLTLLPKGKYFISYDGIKIIYDKKTDPPKNLTPAKECK